LKGLQTSRFQVSPQARIVQATTETSQMNKTPIVLVLIVVCSFFGCTPPPPTVTPSPASSPQASASPEQPEPNIFVLRHNEVELFQATSDGLKSQKKAKVDTGSNTTVAVADSQILLRSRDRLLRISNELEAGPSAPIGYLASSSPIAVQDGVFFTGGTEPWSLVSFDSELKELAAIEIPGPVDHLIIYQDVAYILDKVIRTNTLVKVGVENPAELKLLESVKVPGADNARLTHHWLDPEKRKWYVIREEWDQALLVYSMEEFSSEPLATFSLGEREEQVTKGLHIHAVTPFAPSWALVSLPDAALALVRLQVTDSGLELSRKLVLEPYAADTSVDSCVGARLLETPKRLYAAGKKLYILNPKPEEPKLMKSLDINVSEMVAMPQSRH
jgi:biopolymer transport protein ExbD